MKETVLNEAVLGKWVRDSERGFILHVVQIYPQVAMDICYSNAIQLFFCFKPIFDMLSVSEVRMMRESLTEKIKTEFIPFCSVKLTIEAQEFIKEKIFDYANAADVAQVNRNKLFDILTAFEEQIKSNKQDEEEYGSDESANKIGIKSKVAKVPEPKKTIIPEAAPKPVQATPIEKQKKKKEKNQKVVALKSEKTEVVQEATTNHALRKSNSKELLFDPLGKSVHEVIEPEQQGDELAGMNIDYLGILLLKREGRGFGWLLYEPGHHRGG
jgi:hypothetical protein